MKKFVSLLVVLMMACMLLPAVAEEDLTGDWYLVDVAGMNPADMGMSITMTLNADGTANMVSIMSGTDLSQDGTWRIEGDKLIVSTNDGAPDTEMTIGDGVLTGDMGGGAIATFSRDASATAETTVFAEVNPDAQPEDFNGNWYATHVSMQGMTISVEAAMAMGQFDEVPVLSFQDGKIAISGSLEMLFGEEGFDLTYENGGYGYTVTVGENSMGFYLNMLQDGMMQFTVSMGQDIIIYFAKAE